MHKSGADTLPHPLSQSYRRGEEEGSVRAEAVARQRLCE